MNIQNYSFNTKKSPSFGKIQTSVTKAFSEEQVNIARYIVKEARRFQNEGWTLEELYARKGIDLVIEPAEKNMVSLFMCKAKPIEGRQMNQYAVYARHGSDFIKIGSYDCSNINQVEQNLVTRLAEKP